MTDRFEANKATEELSDAEQKQAKDLQRAQSLIAKDAPLVTHMYTADPSAHVFAGKVYIYPSHDIETDNEIDDLGNHFAMRDYHVFSLDENLQQVTDHGVALSVDDVKWASKQMWAPDAACKNGHYYFYFPARDQQGIFRIGVASAQSPTGPFTAQDDYIAGTFSIDPQCLPMMMAVTIYTLVAYGADNYKTGKVVSLPSKIFTLELAKQR